MSICHLWCRDVCWGLFPFALSRPARLDLHARRGCLLGDKTGTNPTASYADPGSWTNLFLLLFSSGLLWWMVYRNFRRIVRAL